MRSALADTWPDQTSTPAVPANAPSIRPPASSAEPCRLTSQRLHRQERCIQPRDASDKEPGAPLQFPYCGRYPVELYNTVHPHSRVGYRAPGSISLCFLNPLASGLTGSTPAATARLRPFGASCERLGCAAPPRAGSGYEGRKRRSAANAAPRRREGWDISRSQGAHRDHPIACPVAAARTIVDPAARRVSRGEQTTALQRLGAINSGFDRPPRPRRAVPLC